MRYSEHRSEHHLVFKGSLFAAVLKHSRGTRKRKQNQAKTQTNTKQKQPVDRRLVYQ